MPSACRFCPHCWHEKRPEYAQQATKKTETFCNVEFPLTSDKPIAIYPHSAETFRFDLSSFCGKRGNGCWRSIEFSTVRFSSSRRFTAPRRVGHKSEHREFNSPRARRRHLRSRRAPRYPRPPPLPLQHPRFRHRLRRPPPPPSSSLHKRPRSTRTPTPQCPANPSIRRRPRSPPHPRVVPNSPFSIRPLLDSGRDSCNSSAFVRCT